MTKKADFYASRNAQDPGPTPKCRYCDYQPTDYMDSVDHKEAAHGISRGMSDVYPPSDRDKRFADLVKDCKCGASFENYTEMRIHQLQRKKECGYGPNG